MIILLSHWKERKRLKQRLYKLHALGCPHVHLTPAFSSPTHITCLQSLLTGVCRGRPLKGRWSCSVYSQHYTLSKAQGPKGPSTRQRLGNSTAMEALGCRQAASQSMQDTQILLFYLHTTGQDVQPPIYWSASRWTNQPCATQTPRTTGEMLYLKQNSLILCTRKTQISAWLQHE